MESLSLASITAVAPSRDSSGTAGLAGSSGHSEGQTGGEKRPLSDYTNERLVKRRSSKACLSCRNRKVRCDVIMGGQPCTNCRLDGVECIIKEPNRGRRPAVTAAIAAVHASKPSVSSAESSSTAPGIVIVSTPTASAGTAVTPDEARPSRIRAESETLNFGATTTTVSMALDRESSVPCPSSPLQRSPMPVRPQREVPRRSAPDDYLVSLSFEVQPSPSNSTSKDAGSESRLLSEERKNQQARHTTIDTYRHMKSASPEIPKSIPESDSALSTSPGMPACHKLPPYIRPLGSHITPRDVEYLADKGALTILDEEFRNELLRIYVNIVYPFMPAIDLGGFVDSVIQGDGTSPVSLLLFQAVMFASVTFVDARFLREHGYRSHKEARKVFFCRVRLLYGLDCEPDRVALLQAVLLMTYWYECPDDDKDTWYWMGVALTMAQVAGLHRNPENLKISASEKQLRRRLWWSCVIRDRLLALGIRRPARILDDEFDVPVLALEDFDICSPSEPLRRLIGGSALEQPNTEGGLVLAVMAVELSKLCVCLGHILRSQYSIMGRHPRGSEYLLKALVVPKRSKQQVLDLVACDKELMEWSKSQDPRSRYRSSSSAVDPIDIHYRSGRVIRLHQALLYMIYLTAQSVLHRPQAMNSSPDVDAAGTSRKMSRERITDAAISISKLAFDLQASGQLRYLSTSSVPAFVSASLIHLLDIRSPNEEVRNISIGRFYQCVQALQELQDMYSSADYGLRFLVTVLQNTGIRVPMFRSHLLPFVMSSAKASDDASKLPSSLATQPIRFYAERDCLGQMDTTYPSPSSSGNYNFDETTERSEAAMQLEAVHQQQSSLSLTDPYGLWGQAGSHLSVSMAQPSDVLGMSPYLSTWTEIDGLVSGAIDFDTDPTGLLANAIDFM